MEEKKMERRDAIQNAYRLTGSRKETDLYD